MDVLRTDHYAVNDFEWYAQTLNDALQTEYAVVRIINQQKNFGVVSPKRKSKSERKRKTTLRTQMFLYEIVQCNLLNKYRFSKKSVSYGVSADSSTVRRRHVEAVRFARKPIKNSY
ncbi:hypothetical protein TNCV_2611441 [Trichonephila clavipes]|nr:hypothetical protein TNCV_2611441 [Trichonephila clavipes]